MEKCQHFGGSCRPTVAAIHQVFEEVALSMDAHRNRKVRHTLVCCERFGEGDECCFLFHN